MDTDTVKRKSEMYSHDRGGAVIEQTKRCICVGMLGGKYETLHDQTRRVYDIDGCAPTQHTVGGGNLETKIVEANSRFYQQVLKTAEENKCVVGDVINAFNQSVDKSGVCPTVTTRPEGFKTAILPIDDTYRVRKLTERECFRLMGVKDEDFDKVKKNQSKSKLYHLAGDSIVTTCLMAIFGQMLDVDWEEKIREVTK